MMRKPLISCRRLSRRPTMRLESLETRDLLTVVAEVGNDINQNYDYVDSWLSNLVINETDTFTNNTSESILVESGTFGFVAQQLGGPVTPFVVLVNGDNDFTVLATGSSKTSYNVGANQFDFGFSDFVIGPGQTVAVGFLDAQADGSGGAAGAVIPFNLGSDEVWYSGGPNSADSASISGSTIVDGANTYDFSRDYAFYAELEALDGSVIAFGDGGFETPTLDGGETEEANAPAGWVVSGEGTAGVQNDGLTPQEGSQFVYLEEDAILTTATGVTAVDAGSYDITVALGNASGNDGQAEPGTYIVRVGYGRDANDFTELTTKSLDGDLIDENQWRDLTLTAYVSDTSEALGQKLLVQIEHVSFDNPEQVRIRGFADNVRVSFQETTPLLELADWETGPGEALLSDKYRVWVTMDGVRQEVEVLMSESIDDQGGTQENTDDRTLSWISLASNYSSELIFEVEKIYGEGAIEVEVVPSDYGIETVVSADGKTATFTLDRSRYVSVNFLTDDNMRTENGLVKNSLMIFADDPETDVPDPLAAGTVVVDQNTTLAELASATVIYIPQGYYHFETMFGTPVLELQRGQTLYTESGAFIVGMVGSAAGEEDNMTVYGRGAFTGREEVWQVDPTELINLEGRNNRVEGIFAFDGNHHGITPGYLATIEDVKMWGWHNNNDGFRPWGGTVDHSFLRPTDDAFYVGGRGLTVTETIVWQGANGGVVTYGWAGDYGQSGFLMKDSHVIYPEWRAIGNNGGVLMSQSDAQAIQYDVRFENLTIDGDLPAITNIKLGSNYEPYIESALVGELSGLVMRNITVNGRLVSQNVDRNSYSASKSLLEGTVLNDGDDIFMVQDVTFDNLVIDGVLVTDANKDQYFDIDPVTTSNIQFVSSDAPSDLPIGDFNLDGVVDAADYTVWRDNNGAVGVTGPSQGDADGDGDVDQYDYNLWLANYGAEVVVSSGALAISETVVSEPEPVELAATVEAAEPALVEEEEPEVETTPADRRIAFVSARSPRESQPRPIARQHMRDRLEANDFALLLTLNSPQDADAPAEQQQGLSLGDRDRSQEATDQALAQYQAFGDLLEDAGARARRFARR